MRLLLLALLLAAACSPPPAREAAPPALLDLWTGLDAAQAEADGEYTSDACAERFGTYFADFGARGLACVANSAVPLGLAVGRFPGPAFRSGPHRADGGTLRLDLLSDDFAHYNPAFIEWVADHAIVDGATARALIAPIYARHVRRLARVFWLVHEDLAAGGFPERIPSGPTADYARYLETGSVPPAGREPSYPGFSMITFSDRNDAIARRLTGPGGTGYYSALYEANTAVGFWVRRRADGTASPFRHSLARLLAAYDADWLAASR